ncbi:hypothetical protein [Paraburkholderia lycopersici]|uniref:Uncharacterized protein n=1 Tax=Paraburkholderia lycopersici TaxID=416944 RepID=A0A1G6TDK4_9BURK|nr:hypothetical protein [Paraburkholderia lycopersici]SDD27109.1 hypothetical protein SAMN05421548_1176 [Paraburkholderia lycopersici]
MTQTTRVAAGIASVAAGAALAIWSTRSLRDAKRAPTPGKHVAAARAFNHGSALLALSVLADSAMEHYRGSFENPAMYLPPVVALCSLGAALHGGADQRAASHRLRHAIQICGAATGATGTVFHLYNVTRRPGGLTWHNLFYGAPAGAPFALVLSGVLGAIAEQLRDEPEHDPQLFGMPAGKALALVAGAGLLGTAAEAALLHFRGSFQHPAMYAPVTVVPVGSALLAHAALALPRHAARASAFARWWLRLTAALGFAGLGFHANGVARAHGGWRNWSQNLFAGPPLPAPPSFSALALAGLAALRMRETER